jgi:hypothetical protein
VRYSDSILSEEVQGPILASIVNLKAGRAAETICGIPLRGVCPVSECITMEMRGGKMWVRVQVIG